MSQVWKNTGAPFDRASGETVGTGETFTAPASAWDVVMRRKKLEPVNPAQTVTEGSWADDRNADIPERFPGVEFASERAYEIARDAVPPLYAYHFAGQEGTGQNGAFRADDVRDLVEARRG